MWKHVKKNCINNIKKFDYVGQKKKTRFSAAEVDQFPPNFHEVDLPKDSSFDFSLLFIEKFFIRILTNRDPFF